MILKSPDSSGKRSRRSMPTAPDDVQPVQSLGFVPSQLPDMENISQFRRVRPNHSNRSCSDFCIRMVAPHKHTILFTIFNVYFIGISPIYLYLGCVYWVRNEDMDPDNLYHLETIGIILTFAGLCTISASIIGSLGFIISKISFLRYMLVVHILESLVFFGLAIYIGKFVVHKAEIFTRRYLDENYNNYFHSQKAKAAVDKIQTKMECCGIFSSKTFSKDELPVSCCPVKNDNRFMRGKCGDPYEKGCFLKYYTYHISQIYEAMWLSIFIGFAHLIGGVATYFPSVLIAGQLANPRIIN